MDTIKIGGVYKVKARQCPCAECKRLDGSIVTITGVADWSPEFYNVAEMRHTFHYRDLILFEMENV